jgi:hypothetical protein
VALRFRNCAFESAALDLALRQAGRSPHDVLGLEPRPVRFVNSLGLGKGAFDGAGAPAASAARSGWAHVATAVEGARIVRATGSQDARADPNAGLAGPADQSRANRHKRASCRWPRGRSRCPDRPPASGFVLAGDSESASG